MLQAQVQVEQFGNFKQALAYYDLSGVLRGGVLRAAEIRPLAAVGLMGYCGAGLEQRLVKLHRKECWVVADPIRDVTVLDRELIQSEGTE